jgi:2',3'-cyclic-nucleotide 2'-phosphodiesterase (5'-nucleotidase family)
MLISLLCFFLMATAVTALAQPATKPQTSPPQSGPARVTETQIDAGIADDPALNNMLAAYSPKVRELETVIGKLKGELKKGATGAGSLGNFVTDGMRAQAALKTGKPITVALVNAGGLRRNNVQEGELRIRDIFELLPFENALITVELNGEQLKRLLDAVVSSGLAQSGARIVYKTTADKKNETETVKLVNKDGEVEINPAGSYTVVTIDYIYNVGRDRYSVLREGTMKALGLTLRDAMIAYVKSETAAGREIRSNLDGRFSLDRANSVNPDGPPQ